MTKEKSLVRVKFGSHLYGTATPASDLDFKSVHIPCGSDIVLQRVKPVRQTNTKSDTRIKNAAEDVDEESYALHKFLQLVAAGDMMATELLFAPEWSRSYGSPEWEYILEAKPRILNRQCEGFVGYCRKQAAKYGIRGSRVACTRAALGLLDEWMETDGLARLRTRASEIDEFLTRHEHTGLIDLESKGEVGTLRHWEICGRKLPFTITMKEARSIIKKLFDNYGERALAAERNQGVDWKAVSHAVRVAEQAIEMLRTGHITFPRPNAEALLMIKQGQRHYPTVATELEALLDEVERASQASALPEKTDAALTDALVYQMYHAAIVSEGEQARMQKLACKTCGNPGLQLTGWGQCADCNRNRLSRLYGTKSSIEYPDA